MPIIFLIIYSKTVTAFLWSLLFRAGFRWGAGFLLFLDFVLFTYVKYLILTYLKVLFLSIHS